MIVLSLIQIIVTLLISVWKRFHSELWALIWFTSSVENGLIQSYMWWFLSSLVQKSEFWFECDSNNQESARFVWVLFNNKIWSSTTLVCLPDLFLVNPKSSNQCPTNYSFPLLNIVSVDGINNYHITILQKLFLHRAVTLKGSVIFK